MILAIVVDGHLKTSSTKYQSNLASGFGEEDFQSFLYSCIRKKWPVPGDHAFFIIGSIMILAILIHVDGDLRTISTQNQSNLTSGFGEEDFQFPI